MRKKMVGEAAIRCRHAVLRAALAQALRWDWVGSNPASQARLRQPKRAPRDAMTDDGESYVDDVPTKTANARTVTHDDETVQDIVQL